MMSMPSLVYVLAMSGALHLVNYYRETVEEAGLGRRARQDAQVGLEGGLPVLHHDRPGIDLAVHQHADADPQLRYLLGDRRHVHADLAVHFLAGGTAIVAAPPARRRHGQGQPRAAISPRRSKRASRECSRGWAALSSAAGAW